MDVIHIRLALGWIAFWTDFIWSISYKRIKTDENENSEVGYFQEEIQDQERIWMKREIIRSIQGFSISWIYWISRISWISWIRKRWQVHYEEAN